MSASVERKRVVIIGAGASGIAAATRLYENGIEDIVVLEAENRIGGRVHTIEIENGILEMGAQWIHGEKGNVVCELASARKLIHDSTTSSSSRNITFVRSSGEIIEPKLESKMDKVLRNRVLEFDCLTDHAKSFKSYGELYLDILKTELNKTENSDIPDDLKWEFVELCHQILNSHDAADTWWNTSVSTFDEYTWNEGNQGLVWNGTGYHALFDILMEKSQKVSNGRFKSGIITLNTEVERMSLDEQNSSVIMVECSNGKKINADHVIITVSVGVLREMRTKLFGNIPMSELKLRTINNLEFGTVDKIYLEFSKPWWPNGKGFELLWTRKDREEYIQKGLGWVAGIFAVAVVQFSPNTLCCWLSGASARDMENFDEKVVLDTVMQMLRKFMSQKWEIPDAVRIIRSTWYSNKHFRGSYSSRSIRTDAANVSAFTLSMPVNNSKGTPILLFAGEATSSHHYGTVHGAVESGWREADRLIKYINGEQEK